VNDVVTSKCPFAGDWVGGAQGSKPTLEDWWPNRLRVEILQCDVYQGSPLPQDFDYAAAFGKLDLEVVKQDIKVLLRSSAAWWPADYGHYGPQMVRMAWHSAGTYRIADGRGGAGAGLQRFAPIGSWEDNGNTDKSRRLLWPIKQKYGRALSWADLIVLTGNCALEMMGLELVGFGGGRRDAWQADDATYWGPECWDGGGMIARDKRWEGKNGDPDYMLQKPLAASHQALIYVHPEGPYASGDPIGSARDIRITFTRMAMNDEETVALIAGGHAFGKSHGMTAKAKIGPPPEAAPMEAMGLGWINSEHAGGGNFTTTSGIEGSWTPDPTQWDNSYLENLFKYEWVQTRSPIGAVQWTPADSNAPKTPDAHVSGLEYPLMMMTSDIALKMDPDYRKVCEKFLRDFDAFTDAFTHAWYKLTHRDMGPKSRYLGAEVPEENFVWQAPIPTRDHPLAGDTDLLDLKRQILASGLSISELVSVAWSAAATYRDSDKRGGVNGARIRLAPQKDWAVNNPERLQKVIAVLDRIRCDFDKTARNGVRISLADLIVLGGAAAVEHAAKMAGIDIAVPFVPGRMDTSQEWTDIEEFSWLEPVSDGFRNYHKSDLCQASPEALFLDRAALMTLTAPEWTVLVGGLRVLDTNFDESKDGVFTDRPGVLTNDFFINLCNMDYVWQKTDPEGLRYALLDRDTGKTRFTATRCDLVFGANAQLRNLSEYYAAADSLVCFINDFVAAWDKVMMLDRFDIKRV